MVSITAKHAFEVLHYDQSILEMEKSCKAGFISKSLQFRGVDENEKKVSNKYNQDLFQCILRAHLTKRIMPASWSPTFFTISHVVKIWFSRFSSERIDYNGKKH